ncbi:Sec-independent protein translocase TatD [Trichormus variabilis ATCC 29413]|uniref:D-aminoacyl-tRNA deacylase n=2 Tax=Anabaena variabilis TaxID=264691 RepID=Q3M5D1_TRIV2|nr:MULTISPECIES: TatD family hydrolase [Nostocaceae]ABA23805.1 Sec-independent protein translocase TatD [Trichormus variabilis ATCC 29413]MBC1214506.1 TatD family hydrolase [Trichormus variabilis ARAD]MBC1253896.1 TatD family hydrolase [Trichormus variabilis V5]MBC1266401.1 TatD family hydrolase [Trichormus variabilis FSR]MBC1300310.1 TatD family hydrolase [Trichormus variabilis N2B]
MQLIDTHVHLNFDTFQPDLAEVRSRWQEAGVVHLVHSCVEPEEFPSIQAIAHQFPELSFAVGLHPLDADKWQSDTGEQILSLARSDSKIVAIGETGLDFYKADNDEQQRMVFEAQLAIASQLNLPVIIHCRDAAVAVREILQKWQERTGDKIRGVMHCWGGTPEETQWFLDLGFYISFSGTVTFKSAKTIQASAAMVKSDRLLIETDCPFLAPVPKRGEKRNEPAYVRHVAEQIAALRGETLEAISAQTTQNACELFGLVL